MKWHKTKTGYELLPRDKHLWPLTPSRILFRFKTWWDWHRKWYVYDWNFRINAHPWYKLWHRSKLVRDLYSAVYNYRLRRVARFIDERKLWWNAEDAKRWNTIHTRRLH